MSNYHLSDTRKLNIAIIHNKQHQEMCSYLDEEDQSQIRHRHPESPGYLWTINQIIHYKITIQHRRWGPASLSVLSVCGEQVSTQNLNRWFIICLPNPEPQPEKSAKPFRHTLQSDSRRSQHLTQPVGPWRSPVHWFPSISLCVLFIVETQ